MRQRHSLRALRPGACDARRAGSPCRPGPAASADVSSRRRISVRADVGYEHAADFRSALPDLQPSAHLQDPSRDDPGATVSARSSGQPRSGLGHQSWSSHRAPEKASLPDDAAVLRERSDIVDLTADLTDFAETAALISCLDLVITVDTSVAHLAGALGRPATAGCSIVPTTPGIRACGCSGRARRASTRACLIASGRNCGR